MNYFISVLTAATVLPGSASRNVGETSGQCVLEHHARGFYASKYSFLEQPAYVPSLMVTVRWTP